MKTRYTIFAVVLNLAASAVAQSVLLAGFDGNQTENNAVSPKTLTGPVQHSTAVGNVSVSLSTSSTLVSPGFDWSLGFQSASAIWGSASDLDPDASTANNNAVYAHDALATIQMTITNTGTNDVTLDKLMMRVKRDNATGSATGIRVTYVSGDLTDTDGSNALFALNAAASTVGYDLAFSNLISDIVLAAGESATFTWASEGGTGSRTRFDNIAVTGAVTGGPDTDPPTPNPMTWASQPAAAGDSSITMTATTATDPSGVQYEFTRYAADGTTLLFTSPWQLSPTYTDTDLTPDTTYSYTVRARDLSTTNNTTATSTPAASATTDPADTAAPTPNPMTWASVPAAVNDNSITMTATTASDPSGVKYQFTRYAADGTTLLFTSPWQDSPEFTDTGLNPSTQYTYIVKARDKSLGQYETAPSTAASAITPAVPVGPVLLGGFDGNNAVNAPKQHSSATGNFSMALSATTTLAGGLNPGALMQSASTLWGTTDLDPDANNANNNAVLIADVALELVITVTNTSVSSDVSLDTLHWISKRDGSNSPTTATITYTSGSLNQPLGTNASASLGAVGTIGHEFALSGMLSDRVLAPGQTATFTFSTTTEETNQRLRMDNIALSGTFSPSDYYFWVLDQGWTYGAPGTGGSEDFDKDGLTNDMERMFALDPNSASSSNPYVTPFDPDTGTLSYSRRTQSITGLNYPVWFSTDLQEWFRDIYANESPGTPENDVEIVGVQINPVLLSQPKLFIQLRPEPPVVLPAPELINMVGSVNTVTVNFTQELYQLTATDPASYTVQLAGGGTVVVTDASLSENGKTVTLTLGSTLGLASTYNVTFNNLTGVTGVPLAGSGTGQFETWDNDPNGVRVFILAGQSNMVGYGHSEEGYGGGAGAIGSLRYLANNDGLYPEYDYASLLANPADPVNSAWATRSNVKVWWHDGTSGNLGGAIRKGDLAPNQGAPNGGVQDPWFGPEYAFGQVIGDLYPGDKVLLIKAAWGGRSLGVDFRPPSAVAKRGGQVGNFYQAIIDDTREVLTGLGSQFPEWAGQGYQIVGIAWHQGFNDRVDEALSAEYKDNLPNLISDLRGEFGKPDLPFVIATTGMAMGAVEPAPYTGYSLVEKAQLWVSGVPQPANVRSTDTRSFQEVVADSPRDQGYHWNHNARSYFRVGKALGDDMVELLSTP